MRQRPSSPADESVLEVVFGRSGRLCAALRARCSAVKNKTCGWVRRLRGYDLRVPDREILSIELDAEIASWLRAQAADAHVTEGEIVERTLRAADLRLLATRIRSRSDLDEDTAMRLVREELAAARADARNRAA